MFHPIADCEHPLLYLPGTGKASQEIAIWVLSLVPYVAEDSLVSHQWEERPLVLRRSYAPVQENARARKQEWVGWGAGWEKGIEDFQ